MGEEKRKRRGRRGQTGGRTLVTDPSVLSVGRGTRRPKDWERRGKGGGEGEKGAVAGEEKVDGEEGVEGVDRSERTERTARNDKRREKRGGRKGWKNRKNGEDGEDGEDGACWKGKCGRSLDSLKRLSFALKRPCAEVGLEPGLRVAQADPVRQDRLAHLPRPPRLCASRIERTGGTESNVCASMLARLARPPYTAALLHHAGRRCAGGRPRLTLARTGEASPPHARTPATPGLVLASPFAFASDPPHPPSPLS
jgi:hypothetical protein